MSKQIKSYWYSITHRVRHNPPLEFVWADGSKDYIYITAEKSSDDTLYSHAIYPTKIKADDLPNWYMHGRYYKEWGYVNIKNITDIRYKPNTWINHLFRDDTWFLWFNGKKCQESINGDDWYQTSDMLIEGTWTTDLLAHLTVYNKNIDTKPLLNQVMDKITLYNEKHPDEHDCITTEQWFEVLSREILKLEELNNGNRPTNKITTESDKS